jgi:flagellar biogenesis protein FliO
MAQEYLNYIIIFLCLLVVLFLFRAKTKPKINSGLKNRHMRGLSSRDFVFVILVNIILMQFLLFIPKVLNSLGVHGHKLNILFFLAVSILLFEVYLLRRFSLRDSGLKDKELED